MTNYEYWCAVCKHKDKEVFDHPCYICLDNPADSRTKKPPKFEPPNK